MNARFPPATPELTPLTQSLYDFSREIDNEFAQQKRLAPQVASFEIQALGGAAGAFAWKNPYPNQRLLIVRVVIDITTPPVAANLDVGTTPTAILSDNLIDDAILAMADTYDNIANAGVNGRAIRGLDPDEFVTGTLSGDTTGLVGNAYIEYYFA